jgi:hypothetical protein
MIVITIFLLDNLFAFLFRDFFPPFTRYKTLYFFFLNRKKPLKSNNDIFSLSDSQIILNVSTTKKIGKKKIIKVVYLKL